MHSPTTNSQKSARRIIIDKQIATNHHIVWPSDATCAIVFMSNRHIRKNKNLPSIVYYDNESICMVAWIGHTNTPWKMITKSSILYIVKRKLSVEVINHHICIRNMEDKNHLNFTARHIQTAIKFKNTSPISYQDVLCCHLTELACGLFKRIGIPTAVTSIAMWDDILEYQPKCRKYIVNLNDIVA